MPAANVFVQADYTFPRENADNYCTFRDPKTTKCKIHVVKPETCVAGPVTFDINKNSQKIEWYLKTDRICSLAGEMYRNKAALEKHLESTKKEILRLVSELDAEDLQAILKREEPDTFKIGENNVKKSVLDKLTC